MFSADRSIAIILNGEIYNFKELRQELMGEGRRFVTSSDTEVIIQAWEKWGENCLEHLGGMFAFALWDEKERTLFLARDRLGEKPLYYALLPDQTLIFGSELKALLVHPDLPRKIDPCAVEEFFALGYIAEPRTIYEGVSKLEAGCSLLLQRGRKPVMRRYWDAKPTPINATDVTEITESLLARLGASVKAQLVSDVPVGAFLSGGTDSSGTMALMAEASKEPVSCFTIGFDDPKYDESQYASLVAARYHAQQFVERMTGDEIDGVARLPRIFDEPFGDSSALPTYYLSRLARRNVKVALSGDGGDELFAGYRRYAFHLQEENLRELIPEQIRAQVFGRLSRYYPQADWAPRYLRARHTFRELSLNSEMGYFWNVSVTDDDLRAQLFSARLRDQLQGYHASDVLLRHKANAPRGDRLTTAQYIDIKTWLPGDILTKVDRAAMAFGLEVRVPMLDHNFVEWALGLPEAMKIANGQGKYVLKRAFEKLVPKDVLYRPKQGFSVPLASWFRGALGKAFRADIAAQNGLAASGFFDEAVVERLFQEHQSGVHDHSRILWLLWMFQRFLMEVHNARTTPKRLSLNPIH